MIKIPVVPVTANVTALEQNAGVGGELHKVLLAHIVLLFVVTLQLLVKTILQSIVFFLK